MIFIIEWSKEMEKICLFHGIEVKVVNGNIVFICNGDSEKITHILQSMDQNISKEVLNYILSATLVKG